MKPDFDQKISDIIPKSGASNTYKIPVYRLDIKWLNANKQVQVNAFNPVENRSGINYHRSFCSKQRFYILNFEKAAQSIGTAKIVKE